MHVWNLLRAACWKRRTQKIAKNWPSGHHRTTLSGYIFATKRRIHNQKKLVKQQYLLHMSPQYGELQPTSGWDRSGSFGHPCKFQRVLRLGSVTARHCSSGCQPNFAVLNIGCHLYSAGRPSHWALAHISSFYLLYLMMITFNCFKATLYYIIFIYLLIICNTKQSSSAFNSKCVQYNSVCQANINHDTSSHAEHRGFSVSAWCLPQYSWPSLL